MPFSVLVLFDEADRSVAETLSSLLAEKGVEAILVEAVADLRPADAAVAIVSPAGARSPGFRELLEEVSRRRVQVLLLRLDRAPLAGGLRGILEGLAHRGFFEASSPVPDRSLLPLMEAIRNVLRPTRSGSLSYSIPDEDFPETRSPAIRETIQRGDGVYTVEDPPDDPPPPPAPAIRDNVHFSAYAPPAVTPKARFLLSIWAYLDQDRETVQQRAGQGGRYREAGYKGPIKLARGTEVTVYLDIPGLQVDSPSDTLSWEGEIGNCAFSVLAPEGLAAGRYPGTAKLLVAGVQVGRLLFEIEVGARSSQEKELPSTLERVRTMFASYSSKDRAEVLRFRQGAQAAGVEVFVDVLSMREGDDWPRRLEREVVSRDLFCLFWSANASRSEWVEKEWRAAYAAKGVDYIHPVPLADPRDVPPPPELGGSKHFNDLSQIVIAYEELRQRQPPLR